jgi:small subunit ribosomal protein S27e
MFKSKFIEVQCPRCRKIKVTFGKATLKVKCIKCNLLLLKPKGGKAKIKAKIITVLRR